MSPQEALAYKRELVVSNPSQLSQVQIERLGRHPARTKAELDQVYARLRQEFAAQRASDRARYEKERKEEEEAQMKKFIQWEIKEKMEKVQIDDFYGRRKAKRTFEYEVQFVGRTYEDNAWISREKLEEWGFDKLLKAFDV